MSKSFSGRLLFVDLTEGRLWEEPLDADVARQFLGGYGLGAKVIYNTQPAHVDPLGTEAVLGFVSGPLAGTGTPFGVRYQVVGKSPLTGTWGDASAAGGFAPELKKAGYDAVFVKGVADRPVYLWIKDRKPELRDASHLWGLDTFETEDRLREELGDRHIHCSIIGPAGEMKSLIACPITDKGDAPGRSGLGAVMGAKRLKAIAARGTEVVPVADAEKLRAMAREVVRQELAELREIRQYGTCGGTAASIFSGDCPVKNWAGVGEELMPNAENISDENVIKYQVHKVTCPPCPVACNGIVRVATGPYAIAWAQKPEYETLGAFGAMLVNDNIESIIVCNSICDRYGLDTISVGGTIAFAMECYEKGILTREEADGLDLTWGNHQAIVALTQKIAKREGFGGVLADGARVASQRIGRSSEAYVMDVHGQELPMHDPKLALKRDRPIRLALTYQTDATPGRHTASIDPAFRPINATGLCSIGSRYFRGEKLAEYLNAATGMDFTEAELEETGERIGCMRQAFNLREGFTPEDFRMPDRVVGRPPFQTGPLAGLTLDMDTAVVNYFKSIDWDPETGKPSRELLERLGGLDEVVADLYG